MRVKIFECGSGWQAEDRINKWLEEMSDIDIRFIKTTDSASDDMGRDKTIYIFYNESSNNISLNS